VRHFSDRDCFMLGRMSLEQLKFSPTKIAFLQMRYYRAIVPER
jgi:hypothetical protein